MQRIHACSIIRRCKQQFLSIAAIASLLRSSATLSSATSASLASYRDVEETMAMRGVLLTSKTIREWCLKFGQTFAYDLRRRRPQSGDKWHLDEVFIKICGKDHHLWRVVDPDGNVLDILVQSRNHKKAA